MYNNNHGNTTSDEEILTAVAASESPEFQRGQTAAIENSFDSALAGQGMRLSARFQQFLTASSSSECLDILKEINDAFISTPELAGYVPAATLFAALRGHLPNMRIGGDDTFHLTLKVWLYQDYRNTIDADAQRQFFIKPLAILSSSHIAEPMSPLCDHAMLKAIAGNLSQEVADVLWSESNEELQTAWVKLNGAADPVKVLSLLRELLADEVIYELYLRILRRREAPHYLQVKALLLGELNRAVLPEDYSGLVGKQGLIQSLIRRAAVNSFDSLFR